MVLGTHGAGHMVAGSSLTQMSKSNGSTNVSKAVHSRHSKVKAIPVKLVPDLG